MEKSKKIIDIIESAVANLQLHVDEVNDLNVFPVPDGDTGSNMLATIMGGYNKIISLENPTPVEIVKAFAKGCLLSARGNSGVISSQIIRGMADGVVSVNGFKYDNDSFKKILESSKKQAYNSVADPVEGTILSAIKAMSDEYNYDANNILDAFEKVKEIGDAAVERTPSQLEVLKKAGVVDSGAFGLVKIIEGAIEAMKGNFLKIQASSTTRVADPHESGGYVKADPFKNIGYCSEVILTLKKPESFSKDEVIKFLNSIGDSIAIVDIEDILKIHVHTKQPHKLLEYTQKLGEFSKIKIENMTTQVKHNDAEAERDVKKLKNELGIVVVSNGEGINKYFSDLNVDKIISGGQSMNPSVEDITNAVNELENKTILILPNNSNIILTAETVAKNSNKDIFVVPTKSIQQGIIAMQNISKEMLPFSEYIDDVNESFSSLSEGSVTYAVRDTEIDGIKIEKNHFISLSEKKIISSEDKMIDSFKVLFDKIIDSDPEEITIIFNNDISKNDLSLIKKWSSSYKDIDFNFINGGQEVYSILIFGE